MLRTITISCCALLFALLAPVQSQVLIGALGGVNNMTMSGDALPNTAYASAVGFSVSAVADFSLGDETRLSLQPGYTRVGTGITITSALREPRDTLTVAMDYVTLPVLARVVARNGVTYFTGGLQAAMMIKAESTPTSGGSSTDISSVIADVDLALVVGIGAQIPVYDMLATVELRYSQSLMNAGKTEAAAETFQMPARFRLSGLQLLAGVLFSL